MTQAFELCGTMRSWQRRRVEHAFLATRERRYTQFPCNRTRAFTPAAEGNMT